MKLKNVSRPLHLKLKIFIDFSSTSTEIWWFCQQVTLRTTIHYFHLCHNAPCLPLKILHNHCLRFLSAWDDCNSQENDYTKFWGINKMHYGLSVTLLHFDETFLGRWSEKKRYVYFQTLIWLTCGLIMLFKISLWIFLELLPWIYVQASRKG